ncbi:RNA-binding 45 isoform B [Micractinium conductrix]|uniref:RNA-binding 45 isoform B n=1 Tax=Micractinium conductrix TaxID=554055 RepID=A0A2P6VHG9_9CHLO|nr:RNA-binding 45 isoform B [Micractinium conductrix]|eukprot:PSC73543.1 RNA-binding 45 isoform B [Micractinium conductrix]
MSLSIDEPANSRLFVVAGRSTSAEFLRSVFEQFGAVQFVKYLREKGVAYVKYDRASSAALAIENLHEVTLNDGQGPRLKVLLADSPQTRTLTTLQPRPMHDELPSDPDNTPPRSRLFMVVPKSAEGSIIEAEMARFSGMQYCKTDLIATKGIVFVKYAKSSSACLAMETIQDTGAVAGYKVKVMMAEPKTRRGGGDAAYLGGMGGMSGGRSPLPQGLLAGMGMPSPYATAAANASLLNSLNPGLMGQGLGLPDYSLLQSAVGAAGGGGFQQAAAGMGGMGGGGMGGMRGGGTPPLDHAALSQVSLAGFGLGGLGNGVTNFSGMGGLGGSSSLLNQLTPSAAAAAGPSARGLSKTRLFVVVHKSVGDESLARIFRAFPGMEYCDLKKDRMTGRSKGYAYVSYLAPEAAAAAAAQLNGIDFPPQSGYKLKVMYAEPLGARPMARGPSHDMLAGGEEAGGGADSGGYLAGPPSGGPSAEDNVAAAAAAAAVAGMHHSYLAASPQEATCSTSMQLHTPMTGESTAGMLQSSTYSGEPSPMSRPDGRDATTHSAHSSPLRPSMGGLLEGADLAAVQNSLAGMRLQENGHMHSPISGGTGMSQPSLSDGATSSWRALSPDHLQHQQHQAAQQHAQSAPGSAAMSPLHHAAAAAQQQAAAAAAGSAGMSPVKPLGIPPHDDTIVYSALSRPLPDYALTHVFNQVGPVEFVRVLADERVAMVKYCSSEGARLAVGNLNGTEVLGEVLHVRHSPPLPLHLTP